MLDAYIIDRLRRERESREPARAPLRIEVPRPEVNPEEAPPRRDAEEDVQERGIAIIDFTI